MSTTRAVIRLPGAWNFRNQRNRGLRPSMLRLDVWKDATFSPNPITRQFKVWDGLAWRRQLVQEADGSVYLGGDLAGGNYTLIESDGTIRFVGNATVWKDVSFPQSVPKATGAGNPTLGTILGNLRGYSYSVNDVNDFDPQEYPHDGKTGGIISWHVHWISMTNVAATRGVKWQIEYSYANPNGVMATPVTVSLDVTIPANTPANTHFLTPISQVTLAGIGPGTQFWVRLTRIASALTAPATDPFVVGAHFHYEIDTVGSRDIISK